MSVDPLEDFYSAFSSYDYCLDNPLTLVDLEGLFVSSGHWQVNPKTHQREWVLTTVIVTPGADMGHQAAYSL